MFFKSKHFSNFIVFTGALFAAYYLLNIIDESTSLTVNQKGVIFIYFLGLVVLAYIFIKKSVVRKLTTKTKQILLPLSIILSIIIFCLGKTDIIPEKYIDNTVGITALLEKNSNSQGYETWITDIELDGNKVDLSKLTQNSFKWEYKEHSLYSSGEENGNVLNIIIPGGKETKISFAKHAWSGNVLIDVNQNKYVYDLYDISADRLEVTIPTNSISRNSIDELFLFIGFSLILCSLLVAGIGKSFLLIKK